MSNITTVYPESTLPVATAISTTLDRAGAHMSNVVSQPSDNLSMSEFGEFRTAPPGNRSDVEFIYDTQPLLTDDISTGGGSAVHEANPRDLLLSINNATNGTIAGRRLHYAVPYTPGSGQEIDITGVLDNANLGGTAAVFLRSTVSGSTTTTTIEQADWTAKTSGVNWNYSQIFRISFQSLKVGRIQFSLVPDGMPTKVAEITNDNIRASGYWQYASLPLYWKIYNTATNTVVEFGYGDDSNGVGFMYTMALDETATARAICGTVKSQGGQPLFDMPGFPFSASNGNTAKSVSTTLIPLLSIQMASTFNSLTNRTLAIPESFSLQTSNPIRYQVLYRPTLTGASFAAVNATNSAMNFDTAATAITGGIVVYEDYLSSGNNQVIGEAGLLGRTIMSLGYAGASDILSIAAIRTAAANADVLASIRWREIR